MGWRWQKRLEKYVWAEVIKVFRTVGVMLIIGWLLGKGNIVSSSLLGSSFAYGMFSLEKDVPRETPLMYSTRATVNVLITLIGNILWVISGGVENVYYLVVENFRRRDPFKMGRILGRIAEQTGLPQVVFVALVYVIIFGWLGVIKNAALVWIIGMRGRNPPSPPQRRHN